MAVFFFSLNNRGKLRLKLVKTDPVRFGVNIQRREKIVGFEWGLLDFEASRATGQMFCFVCCGIYNLTVGTECASERVAQRWLVGLCWVM